MAEYQTLPFQSTTPMLNQHMSTIRLEQQREQLLQLQQSGTAAFDSYSPTPSIPVESSYSVAEEFENSILSALDMRQEEEPAYTLARAPKPNGGAVGELPVGDAILPLLACVCVYIGMRIRRARKVAQMLNVEQ